MHRRADAQEHRDRDRRPTTPSRPRPDHRRTGQLPARSSDRRQGGEAPDLNPSGTPRGGEKRWPPVGRNHGRQRGEIMAVVGEKQMAVDRSTNAQLSGKWSTTTPTLRMRAIPFLTTPSEQNDFGRELDGQTAPAPAPIARKTRDGRQRPLSDSNRRPLPYGRVGVLRAFTDAHKRTRSPCKSGKTKCTDVVPEYGRCGSGGRKMDGSSAAVRDDR